MSIRADSRRWHWRLLLWLLLAAAVTGVLLWLRPSLDKAHVALAYVLVVLLASADDGLWTGLVLAAVAFLAFDWFFLPPYSTLGVANPLDWLVLLTFAVTSFVAARLLDRFQHEARTATLRLAELDRMATLGASTLNVARADEALAAIAQVIAAAALLTECRIVTEAEARSAAPDAHSVYGLWVVEHGCAVVGLRDGTFHLTDAADWPPLTAGHANRLLLPLRVRDRTVGVLDMAAADLAAVPSRHPLVAALAPYAALAVERVRLEQQADHAERLRELNRIKDGVLASVSHDLRTPLTTIVALAHEIAPTDIRAWTIAEEAGRLNRMVADLLDLARTQAGAPTLDVALNAVDDLLGAALQRAGGALAGREVRVEMQEGGTMLVGHFDLPASVRVLTNLLENAAAYSPPPAPIDVAALVRDGQLRLVVSDRGPGIAEADREQIFTPFQRGHNAVGNGSGLGLAIARGLAQAQGGSLVCAPRDGGGTAFTFSLPAGELPPSM